MGVGGGGDVCLTFASSNDDGIASPVVGLDVSWGRGAQDMRDARRCDMSTSQGFLVADARMPCVLGRRDPESRHEARFELRGRRSGDGDMNEANDLTENWGSGVVARKPIAGVMAGVTEVVE